MTSAKQPPQPDIPDRTANVERLLNSEEALAMKPEDRDKMKIAFAEGYLAGKILFQSIPHITSF